MHRDPRHQRQRQHCQSAGAAGEPKVSVGEFVTRLLVPSCHGCDERQPQPAQLLLGADAVVGERAHGPPQCWRRGVCVLGEQPGETVQQEIGGPRRARGRQRRSGGRGDVHGPGTLGEEGSGEQRRGHGLQIGFPRQGGVQRFQQFGGVQEHQRGQAAVIGGERDLGLEEE